MDGSFHHDMFPAEHVMTHQPTPGFRGDGDGCQLLATAEASFESLIDLLPRSSTSLMVFLFRDLSIRSFRGPIVQLNPWKSSQTGS
jgi:hypothetical protein